MQPGEAETSSQRSWIFQMNYRLSPRFRLSDFWGFTPHDLEACLAQFVEEEKAPEDAEQAVGVLQRKRDA